MFKAVLVLCSLFVLTACSSGGDDDNKTQTFEFSDKSTAQKVFKSSRISCQNGDCPPYIGGLTSYTEFSSVRYGVGVCSLTHIGQNRVLTNKHCLPPGMDVKNARCTGRIKLKFPASGGYKEESLDCDRVVDFSPHDVGRDTFVLVPDWAILTFTGATSRPSANIETTAGLEDSDVITAYPVYYTLDDSTDVIVVTGVAKKNDCKLSRKTAFSDLFFSPFSSNFAATNCTHTIIKGNSGSGILNASGNLTGVISYTAKDGAGTPRTGGTNGACIPYLRTPHELCAFTDEENYRSALMNLTYMNRALEFKDNFEIINPVSPLTGADKMYVDGTNAAVITTVSYKAGKDPLLTPALNSAYLNTLSDFLFENVQCIDATKASGKTEIYLPAKDILVWKSTKTGFNVAKRTLKFKMHQEGNAFVASIDSSMYESGKAMSIKLEEHIDRCLESKNSMIFSSLNLACDRLDTLVQEIGFKPLSENSEIYAADFLRSFDAEKFEVTIPACN